MIPRFYRAAKMAAFPESQIHPTTHDLHLWLLGSKGAEVESMSMTRPWGGGALAAGRQMYTMNSSIADWVGCLEQ